MLVRLASGSPRRLELLRQIGLEGDVYTSAFDEVSGDNAEKVVAVNALGKGQVVVEQVGSEIPVIAADTMVVLENEILGKPFDSNDAAVMLRKLSGRVHRVLTGVAVFYKTQNLVEIVETKVWFRSLSEIEINAYVATGEPFDKAGAYGIQGRGAVLVEKIEGCYNNVVGLPLTRLYQMMAQGAAGLSNSELLAILIRTGTQKRSALRIAEELTASSGLYQNIACVHSVAELAKVKGLGPAKAATILAALELGKRIAAAGSQVKLKIESPQKGAEILLPRLRYEQHEKFLVLLLDSKNQVIRMEQVSEGSVNSSVVHPREVFAPALLYHAAAILVAHNHPSGDPKPSQEDKELTRSLNETGIIMGIPLIDHLVIGDGIFFSFREQGYLDK